MDYTGIQTIVGEGAETPYSIIQDGFMGAKGQRPADYTNIDEAKQLLADAGIRMVLISTCLFVTLIWKVFF